MDQVKKALEAISQAYNQITGAIKKKTVQAYLAAAFNAYSTTTTVDWKEALEQYKGMATFVETRQELNQLVKDHFDIQDEQLELALEDLHTAVISFFNLYEAIKALLKSDEGDGGAQLRSLLNPN